MPRWEERLTAINEYIRTGRGTLVSVTSFSYSDRPGVLWGPYLGSTAQSLYASVASTPGT